MANLPYLKNSYEKRKLVIKKRLEDFKKVWETPDDDIFTELCFCLLTPQSRARVCDRAIKELRRTGILFAGSTSEIRSKLLGVRFPDIKAKRIVKARNLFFKDGKIIIKKKMDTKNIRETRDWLVKNVKGIGYKEASHFLRNTGLGLDLAILDRHIMKNLLKYGVIKEIPKCLTKKCYLFLEDKMKEFSKKVDIPLAELDLLFWSEETGEVFK